MSDDDKGVTAHLPHSYWHVIRSIGVENRGEEIPVFQNGQPTDLIMGKREMVLTIVGDFIAEKIDVVEVNGKRFIAES